MKKPARGGKRLNQRERRSPFDRFAGWVSDAAGEAAFFVACVLLVALWVPSYFLLHNLNTWQLIINTITTIITFLLVALLQNTQRRGERAVHTKLDALADGLADLMDHVARDDHDLEHDIHELREAVGLEHRN